MTRLILIGLFCSLGLIPSTRAEENCKPGETPFSENMKGILEASTAALWDEKCAVTSSKPALRRLKGGLSPLWAQEIIGADLTKEFLKEHEKTTGKNYASVLVASLDSGFSGKSTANLVNPNVSEDFKPMGQETHGTQVINLIGGNGDYGVGHDVKILGVSLMQNVKNGQSGLEQAVEQVQKSDAAVVNLEVHTLCVLNDHCYWPLTGTTRANLSAGIAKLKENKIIVAAAGNHHSESPNYPSDPKLSDVILVGSANEEGLVSYFSDESPDVTILAPSDVTLFSPSGLGQNRFGGTSGATPLVTGAVANVARLLPGINAKEVKTLLETSATPMPALADSNKNGAGMLNAYKLAKIAARLEKGWPGNRERITRSRQLYDFKSEASEHFQAAQKILSKATKTCSDFQLAKDELRKSFLLHPDRKTSDLLALMMSGTDSPRNSRFYALRTPQDLALVSLYDEVEMKRAFADYQKSNPLGPMQGSSPLYTNSFDDSRAKQRFNDEMQPRQQFMRRMGMQRFVDQTRTMNLKSSIANVTEFKVQDQMAAYDYGYGYFSGGL